MTNRETAPPITVTVAIATTGRPAVVAQTIAYLGRLNDAPDRVVVSVACAGDIDATALPRLPFPLDVLTGPKGSSVQRNHVLQSGTCGDVVLFLDDDFLIGEGYVTGLRRLFTARPDVVVATGRVLADGIHGPGQSHEQALTILEQAAPPPEGPRIGEVYSAYGCNMAVRVSTLQTHGERFDEALPLYAWLEDMDLSRRMARHGRIVRDDSLVGVHLGTKTGRSAGVLLGYSQIANPVYMVRKGTVRLAPVLKLMTKNILSNLVKSLWPEPWIDRRGRMRGNMIAVLDLLRGRCTPNRALELQ